MAVIKDVLGHAYIKTTESYTRISSEELRKAVEKLTLPPEINNDHSDDDDEAEHGVLV